MLIKRLTVSLFLSVSLVALVGCSSSSKTEHSGTHNVEMDLVPIKVELRWSPDEVTVDQKVIFEAEVTQDDSPVNDAKEVVFEIVNMQDEGQKIELKGKLIEDGIYQAEGTLSKVGEYSVTSHVTARTQHSMPSKELTVQP